ncbi:MAG: hypothetical protein FWF95_04925 [Syntrophorhabdaceae bacterium]|nr:hypothetical protein [Syntrophorhabdaceae bacterium]
MSDETQKPRFQLEKVYADGSREEPELHSLTGIDETCRMGRRGFLLTSAIGMGAMASLLNGCASGSAAQPKNNTSSSSPAAKPKIPGYPPDLPRIDAPKIHGLAAHGKTVHSLAFSPDVKTLFTAGSDDKVKLWSIPDGKLQKTLGGADGPKLVSAALGADGKTLVTGHFDGVLKFRRAPFAKISQEITGDGLKNLTDIAISPDGKTMAVLTQKGITFRSLPSGSVLASMEQEQKNSRIAFSPDGAMLAGTVSSTREVLFWSVPSGDLLTRWNFPAERLAFSADGTLLGATDEGILKLSRMPSGGEEKMLDIGKQRNAPLVFSPDGKWLATRTGGNGVLLLSAPFPEPALLLQGHSGSVFVVAFSGDSRFLAVGTTAGAVYVWEMTGKEAPCAIKAVLYDPDSMPKDVSARQAITSEKSIYIGRCGDPLPAGAVCTCNCVQGRAPVGGTICTCNTVVTCTCNTVAVRSSAPSRGVGGGSYCRCNKICTCVPIK